MCVYEREIEGGGNQNKLNQSEIFFPPGFSSNNFYRFYRILINYRGGENEKVPVFLFF